MIDSVVIPVFSDNVFSSQYNSAIFLFFINKEK